MITLAACSRGPEQPDTVAQKFAEALNVDNVAAAAQLTTDPAKAEATLSQAYEALGRDVRVSVQHAESGAVTFAMDWKVGGGAHQWTYTADAKADDAEGDWKLLWNPALVAPGLAEGESLRYVPVYGKPARILDRAGKELMTQQVVTLVNVTKEANLAAVARTLDLEQAALQSELDAAQGKPVTAVTLREADLQPVEAALSGMPGVTLAKQTRLLAVDRSLNSPTLNGLADLWQTEQSAAAGWAVQAVAADGTVRQLAGADAKPTTDIATTVDLTMQAAAENALANVPQQAAIVAIQPSTGGVLAMAQSADADRQGAIALTGLYPPGSTFKTVTVTAALQAGATTPDTVLPCPGRANMEGRTIPNDEGFDLGSVPLHTAFARSCNTTMARLAVGLPPDGLTRAATQLGLGIDYVTPGLTTVTGSVPVANSPAERVEEGIGQGKVTASPFGMALLTAALARGSVPAPMIVSGKPGTADRAAPPLPAGVAAQVTAMMRETVTAGTATALSGIPDLRGKTGTAEYSQDGRNHAHGWFVAISGDLALAVFIAGAESSAPAVAAAGRFLQR